MILAITALLVFVVVMGWKSSDVRDWHPIGTPAAILGIPIYIASAGLGDGWAGVVAITAGVTLMPVLWVVAVGVAMQRIVIKRVGETSRNT
jgi:hypothetical protein